MNCDIEDLKNGWFEISLGIKPDEIDVLIELLGELKRNRDSHFHCGSDFSGAGGVGDIEIYVASDSQEDNLQLFGAPIEPTR